MLAGRHARRLQANVVRRVASPNVRSWPIADIEAGEPAGLVLMSASCQKRTFHSYGVTGSSGLRNASWASAMQRLMSSLDLADFMHS